MPIRVVVVDDQNDQTGLARGQQFMAGLPVAHRRRSGARQEDADRRAPADLGVDVTPRLKTLKVSEPPKRSAGIMVKDIAELVSKLRNEAKVI